MVDVLQALTSVGFEPDGVPESAENVAELERLIGVPLPSEYRRFLQDIGGGYVSDALVSATVPTPFGEHNLTRVFGVREVINLLDSTKTPRNMICISYGHFGMTGCLSVAGLDHGHVFALDTEMRFYNWNKEVLDRLPHLAPPIKEYFRLRDSGELPEGPWGYENCYHLANSFNEFIAKMHS